MENLEDSIGNMDVGDGCWRRSVLETKCVGDKFEILMTEFACENRHLLKVTNITISN